MLFWLIIVVSRILYLKGVLMNQNNNQVQLNKNSLAASFATPAIRHTSTTTKLVEVYDTYASDKDLKLHVSAIIALILLCIMFITFLPLAIFFTTPKILDPNPNFSTERLAIAQPPPTVTFNDIGSIAAPTTGVISGDGYAFPTLKLPMSDERGDRLRMDEVRDFNIALNADIPTMIENQNLARFFTASEIPQNVPRLIRNITFDASYSGVSITGLYAPAGEILTVEAPAFLVGRAKLIIAPNELNIEEDHHVYNRMPLTQQAFEITSTSFNIGSPFGGAIVLYYTHNSQTFNFARQHPDFTITISGAVSTPYFIMDVSNDDSWEASTTNTGSVIQIQTDSFYLIAPVNDALLNINNISDSVAFINNSLLLQDSLIYSEQHRTARLGLLFDSHVPGYATHASDIANNTSSFFYTQASQILDFNSNTTTSNFATWNLLTQLGHHHLSINGVNAFAANGLAQPAAMGLAAITSRAFNQNRSHILEHGVDSHLNASISETSRSAYASIFELLNNVPLPSDTFNALPIRQQMSLYTLPVFRFGYNAFQNVINSYITNPITLPSMIGSDSSNQHITDELFLRQSTTFKRDFTDFYKYLGLLPSEDVLQQIADLNLTRFNPTASVFTEGNLMVFSHDVYRIDFNQHVLSLFGTTRVVNVNRLTNHHNWRRVGRNVYEFRAQRGVEQRDQFEITVNNGDEILILAGSIGYSNPDNGDVFEMVDIRKTSHSQDFILDRSEFSIVSATRANSYNTVADMMFDGNPNTFYRTAFGIGFPRSFTINIGSKVDLNGLTMSTPDRFAVPRDILIEVSNTTRTVTAENINDIDWQVAFRGVYNATGNHFSTVSARYVRVTIFNNTDSHGPHPYRTTLITDLNLSFNPTFFNAQHALNEIDSILANTTVPVIVLNYAYHVQVYLVVAAIIMVGLAIYLIYYAKKHRY